MATGFSDAEIQIVLQTLAEGTYNYDQVIAKLLETKAAAAVTGEEMSKLGDSESKVRAEIDKTTDTGERHRTTIQGMLKDYRDAQAVSAALGSTLGVTGREFDKLTDEFVRNNQQSGALSQSWKNLQAAGSELSTGVLDPLGKNIVPILVGGLIGLIAALAPLIVLFGSWLIVTLAMTVALAGLLAAVAIGAGAFIAVGVAVGALADFYFTSATKAAGDLTKAQTALTSATVAHDNAVRSLQNAEASAAASRAPTVAQHNAIATAQERVSVTATQLATAQNNLAAAQTAVAQTGTGVIDPLGAIENHLRSVALVLGQQAYPLVVQMALAADKLVAPLQAAGATMIAWFGDRLPAAINLANNLATLFGQTFQALGPIFSNFVDAMGSRSPLLESFFAIFSDLAVGSIKGLLDNLLKLTDWFTGEFPTAGAVAGAGFSKLGDAVQSFANTMNAVVNWISEHWGTITTIVSTEGETIGAFFDALGTGAETNRHLIEVALAALKIGIDAIGFAIGQLREHSEVVKAVFIGLGVVIGFMGVSFLATIVVIVALNAAYFGLILVIGMVVEWIASKLGPIFSWLGGVAHEVATGIGNFFSGLGTHVSQIAAVIGGIFSVVGSVMHAIADVVMTVMGVIFRIFETVFAIAFGIWFLFYKGVFDLVVSILSAIASFIGGIMSFIGGIVRIYWNALVEFIGTPLSAIWNQVTYWFGRVLGFMVDQATFTKDKIGEIFGGIASAIGSAMSAIGTTVHHWLNEARDILDTFIHVTDKALGLSIPDIPAFAGGTGSVPGTGSGDSVLAMLTPGEGVLTVGAVRAIGGPGAVNALNASVPRFADGGIVDSLLGGARGIAEGALGAFSGFSGQLAKGAGTEALHSLIDWVTRNIASIFASMGGGGAPGSSAQVMQWIMQAIAATGVPASWASGLSIIIQYESGGNPLAANSTDINALAGNASVGLMQLTGTNRAQYTPIGMNPLDPVAEIIAGIRYILAQYISIENVPGVRSVASGSGYVPYDLGGIFPHGAKAINTSGRDEFISAPGQMPGNTYVFNTVGRLDPETVREVQRQADWDARTKKH